MNHVKYNLQKLTSALTELGYASFYNTMYPLINYPQKWVVLREVALAELQPYIDLLLLGQTVSLNSLDHNVAEAICELEKVGLFVFEPDNCVRTTRFVLHPVMGMWQFYEIPSSSCSLYFGQDSISLITKQMPVIGKTCLDLCSGPGIQALYAAKHGEKVTSVEINPMAADLARVNAMMNGLEDRISIRLGNLYSAVKGEKFDRIIANPPFFPFPSSMPYSLIGHGGDDGFEVTWKIIDGLDAHLSEGGTAQTIGFGLGNSRQKTYLFLPTLQEKALQQGMNVIVNITNHFPMTDPTQGYYAGMLDSSHNYSGRPKAEILAAMKEWLAKMNADQYVEYDLFITRGNGTVRIQDMTAFGDQTAWYI